MATVRDGQLVATALVSGDSDLGGLSVAVVGGEVIGVSFGNRTAGAASVALARRLASYADEAKPPAAAPLDEDLQLAEEVLERLQQFAAGELVDFSKIPLSLSHLTPFQCRVVKACRAIKRHRIAS